MSQFLYYDSDVVDARNALLAKNWWALVLRGLLAIIFGIVAIAFPAAAMPALVLVFAGYSSVDGVFNIVLAIKDARRHERWGLPLANGVFGILIGIGAALWPGMTVLAFVFMAATSSLTSGALMLGAAFGLKISHSRWLLAFSGILSMLYGILLFVAPLIGAVVLTWWLGRLCFGVRREPDCPFDAAALASLRADAASDGALRLSLRSGLSFYTA